MHSNVIFPLSFHVKSAPEIKLKYYNTLKLKTSMTTFIKAAEQTNMNICIVLIKT